MLQNRTMEAKAIMGHNTPTLQHMMVTKKQILILIFVRSMHDPIILLQNIIIGMIILNKMSPNKLILLRLLKTPPFLLTLELMHI